MLRMVAGWARGGDSTLLAGLFWILTETRRLGRMGLKVRVVVRRSSSLLMGSSVRMCRSQWRWGDSDQPVFRYSLSSGGAPFRC